MRFKYKILAHPLCIPVGNRARLNKSVVNEQHPIGMHHY